MRLFNWICFFLDWSKQDVPDSGYFFFDEDTGEIYSI